MLLGVNIDHGATLRQARYREAAQAHGGLVEPDPVLLAQWAQRAGADGITLHLREDRRHIQDEDVWRMRELQGVKLNLEMACTEEMVAIALQLKPDIVCLVPEGRDEVTTEGGLDVLAHEGVVRSVTERLLAAGIAVSLFIDPVESQVRQAAALGAPYVELHTGQFARAYGLASYEAEVQRLVDAAQLGHDLGLLVNAGHGINYVNVTDIRRVPHLHELNIGHSILSRALFSGIEEAVRQMKRLMSSSDV